MATIDEQISDIEKEIRETPYHKGTEHHIGLLRAKLSKLRAKLEAAPLRRGSGGGAGYAVRKQGDATVVLVGPPSVGKSTLINKLTNAQSRVAPYAFTTVSVIPGMMEYKEARIQILDVPGLIKGAEEGKGRGREVLSVIRGCDLLILITDVDDLEAFERIEKTLYSNGVRINQNKPDVAIEKKLSGGVVVHTNLKQEIGKETIKAVAGEFGYKNAEVTINEKLTMNRLIDSFAPNRVYVPALRVVNKVDMLKGSKNSGYVYISAERDVNLDVLREAIWEKLGFMTVYLVRPEAEPSNDNPIIVRKGTKLVELAMLIGSEFAEGKEGARIWASGAKYPGQLVSLSLEAKDGMQIRFV